jgi:hypothetical protein
MKHLPAPGGWYNQHPDVVEAFAHIANEINQEQSRKEKEKMGPNKPRGAPRAR